MAELSRSEAEPARQVSIQAVGMVTAALIVLLARRHVEKRALLTGGLSGLAGFVFGLVVLSDSGTPFWESHLPAPYVKVTFTIVLAAMSYIVLLTLTSENKGTLDIEHWNPRIWGGLLFAGFLGGIASALTGSGADVMVFLFAIILWPPSAGGRADEHPGNGVRIVHRAHRPRPGSW